MRYAGQPRYAGGGGGGGVTSFNGRTDDVVPAAGDYAAFYVSSINGKDGDVVLDAGDVGAVDEAGAVAATLAFREYGADAFFVPLVVATPTPTLYRSVVTPVVAGGVYSVSLVIRVVGSNGGTDIDVDVIIDGVSLGSILTEAVVAGGGFLLSASGPQSWAPGAHVIEYYVSQPSGPGFVTATLATTSWAREL